MGILEKTNKLIAFAGIRIVKNSRTNNKEIAVEHNSKDEIDRFFSSESNLKSYLSPQRIAFYENITRFFEHKGVDFNYKDITDVGCGTGHLLKYIYDHYKPALLAGFDYASVTLQNAKKLLPYATFESIDLHEGYTQKQKFDIVICSEVIEHLMYPQKAILNLADMVRDKGYLLLTVPNGRLDTYEGHINFWSPTSWDVFLREKLPNAQIESGIFNPPEATYLYAVIQFGSSPVDK